MITVMGATGHTGRKVTEILLHAGERVRALGRSETRLAELERAGADVLAGDALRRRVPDQGVSRR